MMNTKTFSTFLLGFLLLAGCAPATPTPSPTPTLPAHAPVALQLTPGAVTPLPGVTITAAPNASGLCTDPQATALIDTFKKAILNSDGTLLSSLISPTRGMDVAFFRDGTVITYDPQHARFLFETTFEVDWGASPASGAAKKGSFHDVVVPELVRAFNQPYTLHCNELKYGGVSYEVSWPYQGDFYSIYFPGTEVNASMDWHTWVVGVEKINSMPYIYALMQFFWEP